MLYNVRSHVDFPIQKEIFFKDMNFTVAGHGDFTGTFHFFKGGRELKGTFTSPEAGVNAWRFPNVAGSLLWVPSKFRGHRRHHRPLRRPREVRLLDGAARTAGAPDPGRVGRAPTPTSISRS